MIDTSALVAGLVAEHEHHGLARRHLSRDARISSIVLAETYAQLRRTFGQTAAAATAILAPWAGDGERILSTTATTSATVFSRAVELNLGGNIHDALIAQTVIDHGVALVTLDRRQHQIALSLGADSRLLLPGV